MAWCFEDEQRPETDALLDHVRNHGGLVPPLWYWEVANVLNVGLRRGRLTGAEATARLELLARLRIQTDPESVARTWRETRILAEAERLSVYDAAYLELAIRRGAGLATLDSSLASAAERRGIAVVV
jgi:predicted nucleic acid-binding protein